MPERARDAPAPPETAEAPGTIAAPARSGPGLLGYLARRPAEERRAALGELHSRIGNRRVALMIQREARFGLMDKTQVGGFAKDAVTWTRANPDKTLAEFGTYLVDELNGRLASIGVPKVPPPTVDSLRSAGGFAAEHWTVQFNLAGTAKAPLTTKIRDLPADRVSELAGICFHEARHAEQAFLAARLAASESKTPKTAKALATELNIPEWVAEAVLKATGPLPGGREGRAKIGGWRAFEHGGRHRDYWDWNEGLKQFSGNLSASLPSPTPESVEGVKAALGGIAHTLSEWRKDTVPFADRKLSALKAARSGDPVDARVLRDLGATRGALKKVMDAEAAANRHLDRLAARRARLTVEEAKVLQGQIALAWLEIAIAIGQLEKAANDAYRSYPHEADAYEAQAAVQKEIDTTARGSGARSRP